MAPPSYTDVEPKVSRSGTSTSTRDLLWRLCCGVQGNCLKCLCSTHCACKSISQTDFFSTLAEPPVQTLHPRPCGRHALDRFCQHACEKSGVPNRVWRSTMAQTLDSEFQIYIYIITHLSLAALCLLILFLSFLPFIRVLNNAITYVYSPLPTVSFKLKSPSHFHPLQLCASLSFLFFSQIYFSPS